MIPPSESVLTTVNRSLISHLVLLGDSVFPLRMHLIATLTWQWQVRVLNEYKSGIRRKKNSIHVGRERQPNGEPLEIIDNYIIDECERDVLL